MERTLVVLSERLSGYRRMTEARDWGFQHVYHAENHAPSTGEAYSLKKTCAASDNVFHVRSKPVVISAATLSAYERQMRHSLAVYYEFPPIWRVKASARRDGVTAAKFGEMTKDPLFRQPPEYVLKILD